MEDNQVLIYLLYSIYLYRQATVSTFLLSNVYKIYTSLYIINAYDGIIAIAACICFMYGNSNKEEPFCT